MCWVDREGGGFWAVTTHPEVSHIGADPGGFCSSRGILTDEIGTTYETPPTMMHTDPPQHTRYRRLVQPGFKPSMVRLMEAGVTAKATALVDQIQGGVAFDVVQDLSIPFPLQVICELLGVDGSQWPRFFDWSEAVIPGECEQTEEERAALQVEMWEYLIGVAEERRKAPADDLVSVLADVGSDPESGGEELSEAELAMFLIQLLVAGNETTRNLISGGLVALAENPDAVGGAAGRSVADPVRRRGAAALDDAGDLVHADGDGAPPPSVASRWPRVTRCCWSTPRPTGTRRSSGPMPAELRIDRHPNPHVSFGFGPHFCLGAALARLEGRVVLGAAAGPLRQSVAWPVPSSGRRARSSPASGSASLVFALRRNRGRRRQRSGAHVGDVLGIAIHASRQQGTPTRVRTPSADVARRLQAPRCTSGAPRPGNSLNAASAPSTATPAPAMHATSQPAVEGREDDRLQCRPRGGAVRGRPPPAPPPSTGAPRPWGRPGWAAERKALMIFGA